MQRNSSMQAYVEYVRSNPQKVKRAEEMARLATMMLPLGSLGQYAEIINEGAYSVFGLLGVFHDHIIHKSLETVGNDTIIKLRVFLTVLSQTEVTLEMCMRHFGSEKRHDRFVFLVEWVKVLIRCVLLGQVKENRLLNSGGQYDPKLESSAQADTSEGSNTASEAVLEASEGSTHLSADTSGVIQRSVWTGRRSGKSINLKGNLSGMNNTQQQNHTIGTKEIEGLSNETKKQQQLLKNAEKILRLSGELLYILRPVVYLALVKRADTKKWYPWIISMFIDGFSAYLINVALAPPVISSTGLNNWQCALQMLREGPGQMKKTKYTKGNNDEIRRRRILLLLYIMRNPFFEEYTLSLARNLSSGVEDAPVIGSIGKMIEETLKYYQNLYFYISAS